MACDARCVGSIESIAGVSLVIGYQSMFSDEVAEVLRRRARAVAQVQGRRSARRPQASTAYSFSNKKPPNPSPRGEKGGNKPARIVAGSEQVATAQLASHYDRAVPSGIVFIDYQNVFRGARDAFRLDARRSRAMSRP
jgi:hypothetical protein